MLRTASVSERRENGRLFIFFFNLKKICLKTLSKSESLNVSFFVYYLVYHLVFKT